MKFALVSSFAYACGAMENPPPAGSLAVSSGSYDLGGFKCGSEGSMCRIWYPTDLSKGPFPIVTLGHGKGGEALEDLYKSVSSLGIVGVFPDTGRGPCDESDDMLHAISGSKAKPSLHEALAHVDWNRSGILGHSMGGGSAILAAVKALKNPSDYNVKAGIFSHPYKTDYSADTAQITIPSMFTTGIEDTEQTLKKDFEACPGRPKILAQVQGAKHMEPRTPGRLNPFDAHFLGCHVAGLKDSCEKVYGTGEDDMCQANKMVECQIVKSEEVIV